jgi:hypothetical protein
LIIAELAPPVTDPAVSSAYGLFDMINGVMAEGLKLRFL